MINNINYNIILNNVDLSMLLLDNEFNILFYNIKFCKTLDIQHSNIIGDNIKNIFNKSNQSIFFQNIENINEAETITFEIEALKNKQSIPIEIIININYINNKPLYFLILKDLSYIKNFEEDLKLKAFYDQLTNIPNRALFYDRADIALNQAIRSNDKFAIVYIDLDEFKLINDNYGHSIGDSYLKEIAKRLLKSARSTDTVARFGGDEFTILMPRLKSSKNAENLAKRIINLKNMPIIINNNKLIQKSSIGISIYPKDGNTIEELLIKADEAMYKAKKLGNNKYIII